MVGFIHILDDCALNTPSFIRPFFSTYNLFLDCVNFPNVISTKAFIISSKARKIPLTKSFKNTIGLRTCNNTLIRRGIAFINLNIASIKVLHKSARPKIKSIIALIIYYIQIYFS